VRLAGGPRRGRQGAARRAQLQWPSVQVEDFLAHGPGCICTRRSAGRGSERRAGAAGQPAGHLKHMLGMSKAMMELRWGGDACGVRIPLVVLVSCGQFLLCSLPSSPPPVQPWRCALPCLFSRSVPVLHRDAGGLLHGAAPPAQVNCEDMNLGDVQSF